MVNLNKKQLEMCKNSKTDYSDLKAVFINCTLKKSPEKNEDVDNIHNHDPIIEINL